jgi:hypothetical protein
LSREADLSIGGVEMERQNGNSGLKVHAVASGREKLYRLKSSMILRVNEFSAQLD